MEVCNVHDRGLETSPALAGALIDSLASKEDRLWPKHAWPPMEFDRALCFGAKGGHGPIRYFVEKYIPGKSIQFRFTCPKGFDGFHAYEVAGGSKQPVVLRHTLKMNTRGPAILSWPLVYRPMHDALIEDSLATAQVSLGVMPQIQPWSLWVKMLRWFFSRGKARAQVAPDSLLQPPLLPRRRV